MNVGGRNAEAVRLRAGQARKVGRKSKLGRKCGSRKAAEIDVAAEIKLEDLSLGRTELNEICIGAELESVAPPGFYKSVGELRTALNAVHG